jgi:polyisoprenoid-binding protein YceI
MSFGNPRHLPKGPAAVLAAALGLILLPLAAGQAEPRKQEVDLDHVSIYWSVWHGGFSKVTGQFRKINKVDFTFDRDDASKSAVAVEIEAASLDSNHSYRDNWARSEAELNVWKFRTIKFDSTQIEKTGDNTGRMTGNLTMHGETHPIVLEVTYNKGGKHLSGQYSLDGFTAKGTLKRSDFGMKAFIPWVGDEMEFVIQLEAKRPNDPS